MKIHISAPGKAILHGEHAVVHGKAAVAMSISLRTRLTLITTDDDSIVLDLKDLNLKKEWSLTELNCCDILCSDLGTGGVVAADDNCLEIITEKFIVDDFSDSEKLALSAFLYLLFHASKSYNIGNFPSCHVTVESDLSIGAGMGSSASYSVCLATAVLILCGRITPGLLLEDKELINKWAFQAERIFHGKPSGIDNSICTYGGAILYENGISDMLSETQSIRIFLVDTKVQRSTKNVIEAFKKKQQLYPSVMDSIIEAIGRVSASSWKILKVLNSKGNVKEKTRCLEELIVMNQHLLNCLGVGHEKLTKIFDIAKKHSCVSKLTGAGGGGCAIVLLPLDEPGEGEHASIKWLREELLVSGFTVWDIFLGHAGVQVKFDNA